MIKILHSLNAQSKMRYKATEYSKYDISKRIRYQIYTIKILSRRYIYIELLKIFL